MKNLKLITGIAVALFAVFSFSACKKYEEGPSFALSTKKSRLSNDWKLDKYLVNGVDATSPTSTTTVKIEKDGAYNSKATGTAGTIEVDGTWDFSDDKEDLVITYTLTNLTDTFGILKLASKELWLQKSAFGVTQEYQYVPNE